jgi:single-stranded-DNA-specific exonuclease
VIGLAAARLVERHHRPAVVVSISGGEARGSCRSVPGLHITRALDECRDVLDRHGGHAAAAGFTTDVARLADLRLRLNAVIERERPAGGWQRVVRADGELALSDLSPQAFGELEHMEPHGAGNPKPVFVIRGARVLRADRLGKAVGDQPSPHLRLRLSDSRRAVWDAVAWRMGDRVAELTDGVEIEAAVQFEVNEWNGERHMQLDIKDFRPAGRST